MTVENRIPLARPITDEDEIDEIRTVLASGHLTQGPRVAEFERQVSAYIGVPYAFATTSATTALHLSLATLGVGPGDEVAVADFTFPATANVVVQQGARPILVDIDPSTFTMDPSDLAAKITPRTRAIIPVHAFGLAADMQPILAVAEPHGIPVIEDAACALGARYHGRPCGTLGTMGCFSFHPRKSLTTGEGGMITTNDPLLGDKITLLRNHGGVRDNGRYRFEAAGYNYRLSDILAAVGIAQLRKFPAILDRKRELACMYLDALDSLDRIQLPRDPVWGAQTYQSFVITLDDSFDRDSVIAQLRLEDIESTIGTYALHSEPYFTRTCGTRPGDVPNSYRAFRQTLALPLYPNMGPSEVDRVVTVLRRVLGQT